MKQVKKYEWLNMISKNPLGLWSQEMLQYDNKISFTWKSGHLEFNI